MEKMEETCEAQIAKKKWLKDIRILYIFMLLLTRDKTQRQLKG